MTSPREPLRRSLAEITKDLEVAPSLQKQVLPRMTILPPATIQPRQIGGIGSMLPTQTITLPGGQAVEIPEINMDEVNANLAAAGIIPQVPVPAVTPQQPIVKPKSQQMLEDGADILDVVTQLQIEEGLRNADGTAIPQEPAVASPVAITPDPVVAARATLPPLPRQFPLDEAFTNPRDDFMSIERLPSADLPVALASPVGQPAPRAPNTVGGAKLDFFERLPSADLDFFQTTPVPPTPEELRRQAADESAERISGSINQTTNPELFNPDGTPKMATGPGFLDFYERQGQNPFEGLEPIAETTPPAVTPDPVVDPNVSIPTKTPQTTTGEAFFDGAPPNALAPPAPVTPPPAPREDMPFVPSVRQVATGLDPLTEQLLFGIGGEGGFIPGAMRAAEKTFFDEEGKPIVIEEQVAGFSPDQLRAQQLARRGVGIQDRFISGAEGALGRGITALGEGFGRARGFAGQGLRATQAGLGDLTSGLSEQERISRGATGQFGQRLGGLGRLAARSTADFGGRLGESERLLRGTTGAYDPSLTSAFFDPFEDRVVQQTISDVLEQGAQADIAARAGDIARGGESAFGSRARLGASERQEALGRGLGEAIAGIRSRGFTEAQRTGLSEFARQKAAERAASSGLAGLSASRLGAQQQLGGTLRGLSADQLAAQQGLAGTLGALGAQRFGGQQALAGALTGLGGMESQLAQREQAAQFGLGSALQGLGAQAQGAQAADIASLYGMGTQQQALTQAQLDAQRRNQMQAQQAPLAQFQALAPFVSMAPAGQFQTVTDFAPPPSPLQAGLGVGLSTFGALGNLYGGQG